MKMLKSIQFEITPKQKFPDKTISLLQTSQHFQLENEKLGSLQYCLYFRTLPKAFAFFGFWSQDKK